MKKLFFTTVIALCLLTTIKGQVFDTVFVNTPGTLDTILTSSQKATITNLTLSGKIDRRDFDILRDSMKLLETLDLTNVTIMSLGSLDYTVNTIPDNAFKLSFHLKAITIPQSVTKIGNYSFAYSSLNSITLPKECKLTDIGDYAFASTKIAAITLPKSLVTIGDFAFDGCKNITTINIPPHVTTIGNSAFAYCDTLVSFTCSQPSSLSYLGIDLFFKSPVLTTVTFPASITYIAGSTFDYSDGKLISIYAYWSIPYDLKNSLTDILYGVNKSTCTVYVPFGSVSAYKADKYGWGNFTNIKEISGYWLTDSTIVLSSKDSSSISIPGQYTNWTVNTDASWLSISPLNGTISDSLTITASANTSLIDRVANLTIVSSYGTTKSISVKQVGVDPVITIDKKKILLAGDNLTDTIVVSSNAPWTASTNVNWLTLSSVSGNGNDTIIIYAQPNTTSLTRTATITIIYNSNTQLKASIIEHEITITQAPGTTESVVEGKEDVRIFPIPASESFNIEAIGLNNIEVFDVNSKMVLQTSVVGNGKISLNKLPSGIYFVKIISSNGVVTKTLIVE